MDFAQFATFEELCEHLVKNTSRGQDAVNDAVLLTEFCPKLKSNGKEPVEITEQDVENFKQNFNYKAYGLDREKILKKIESYRSIRRCIDEIVEEIPQQVKENMMRQHLKEFWLEKQFGGDFEQFKKGLNSDYWQNN